MKYLKLIINSSTGFIHWEYKGLIYTAEEYNSYKISL